MWPVTLSGRLPVDALVSHYLTNKLIGREPIPDQKIFPTPTMRKRLISSIRRRFQRLSQSPGQVAHVLLTRSPLIHQASLASPFDLHVLSTPPAFILSQDQTLRKKEMHTTPGKRCCSEFETDQRETSLLTYPYANPYGLVFDPKEFLAIRRSTRNKLAFDKCTLLSSQGTDAPTETVISTYP